MDAMFLMALVQDDIDVILEIASALPIVNDMRVKVQENWFKICVEGKLFTRELNIRYEGFHDMTLEVNSI
jgi:hypothetical protein